MINRPQSFWVDDWRAFPDANELRRDGETQKLESRVMNLLVYLREHEGEVVGRDELINEVWGKEALSDHSISVAVGALRRALGDDALQPRYIETVRKKGYRLIAACPEQTAPEEIAALAIETPVPFNRVFTKARAGIAALTAGAAAMAAGIFFISAPGAPFNAVSISDGKPLIIVEDFQNATGDPAFDELAVILSDLFLAELARDNRANIQRALPTTLTATLLEGDPQAGTTASIAGQLVKDEDALHLSIYLEDRQSSQILWSGDQIVNQEKFFGVARSLTANLLTRIAPDEEEGAAEFAFGETEDTRPAQLIRLGQKLEAIRSEATTRTAHSLSLEALEIDPEFGPAHSLLAYLYAENSPDFWDMEGERYERSAKELRLARQYGSNEAHNLVTEAFLRRARDGRPDTAMRLSKRAIDLAPEDPWVLRMSFRPDIIMGDFEGALASNIKTVEHSLDPASILAERIFPLYFLERYDEAVAISDASRALDLYPVYYEPQAAILAGDPAKGFRLWVDLLRAHDLTIENETLPLQWIASGDIKAAYDWLQPQLPEAFSPKNVPLLRASWQMTAGDSEAAMETLLAAARELYGSGAEKATPSMLWSVLQYDPLYDPLRNDPRMAEVIDLVGVQQIVEDYKARSPGGTGVAAFSSPG